MRYRFWKVNKNKLNFCLLLTSCNLKTKFGHWEEHLLFFNLNKIYTILILMKKYKKKAFCVIRRKPVLFFLFKFFPCEIDVIFLRYSRRLCPRSSDLRFSSSVLLDCGSATLLAIGWEIRMQTAFLLALTGCLL